MRHGNSKRNRINNRSSASDGGYGDHCSLNIVAVVAW